MIKLRILYLIEIESNQSNTYVKQWYKNGASISSQTNSIPLLGLSFLLCFNISGEEFWLRRCQSCRHCDLSSIFQIIIDNPTQSPALFTSTCTQQPKLRIRKCNIQSKNILTLSYPVTGPLGHSKHEEELQWRRFHLNVLFHLKMELNQGIRIV